MHGGWCGANHNRMTGAAPCAICHAVARCRGHVTGQRRLAAILAADVAGFSRLMGADEAGTLARVMAHRAEVIDPAVTRHGGRVIKIMGDGVLVELASVVEAVACAVDIQRATVAHQAAEPAERRLGLRIGIHVGDVLVEGADLYGDGVNIAARLEAMADVGGILVSAAVAEQVAGKVEGTLEDLGERRLKNIDRPIRVFRWLDRAEAASTGATAGRRRVRWGLAGIIAAAAVIAVLVAVLRDGPPRTPTSPAWPALESRPAIAVLPFTAPGAAVDAYFPQGLAEEVADALAQFSELAVVAPSAARAIAAATTDLGAIGHDLGARYLVEGTVRREATGQLRVTARLVDTSTGATAWSERFAANSGELLAVSDRITRAIAGALAVRLDQLEQARALARPPDSLEAYDLVLRGRYLINQGTRAANREARELLTRAVELAPSYAPAKVALGSALHQQVVAGWTEFVGDNLDRAERLAQEALAIDARSAGAHRLLGFVFLQRGKYDLAVAELGQALTINPSDSESLARLGAVLVWTGAAAEAVTALEAAQRLNPAIGFAGPMNLALAYYLTGRYADAVALIERSLAAQGNPLFRSYMLATLAAAQARLGNAAAAAAAAASLRRQAPLFSREIFIDQFRDAADREHWRWGLSGAGIE